MNADTLAQLRTHIARVLVAHLRPGAEPDHLDYELADAVLDEMRAHRDELEGDA